MNNSVGVIPSGFSFIDKNWGGIYKGGSYILVGQRKTGRTLVGLQFALEAAKQKEVCLYFTNMRPKDLMIQAASLNFDIQSYMNQNLIIVVRVAPPNDVYNMPNPDDYLVEYLNDIVTVVNQYKPNRIIFDELTPYIGFKNLELLRDAFLFTLETVEEKDISSLFIVGEPANNQAKAIVDILIQHVTGIIYLKKKSERFEDRFDGGTVIISPNVGHTEGQFSAHYKIEPSKGVTVITSPLDRKEKVDVESPPSKPVIHDIKNEHAEPQTDSYQFSNIYNYNDFLLILNNQIALYKSTGQTFNLVSFRLDPAAQVKGLLSLNQLKNAVSLATHKRDKVCVFDNKIIVLLVRSNQKSVINLMSSVQGNLPSSDQNYISAILEYISIYNLEIDDRVANAEKMMEYLLVAENSTTQKYTPLTNYIE